MTAFLTPLRLEYVPPWEYLHTGWTENDGTARWQLTEPFVYHSTLLRHDVTVPTGFRNDLASVPVLPIISAVYGGRYARPAVIHDYLCRQGHLKRSRCDLVLLEAMQHENELELAAMDAAGIDNDEIAERKGALAALSSQMYLAVCFYTRTGFWKTEVDKPGFEVIG